jgi:DNA-binding MarR family transcriptional regulator/N-acetylglutamate synthase-like GNAT family acetyltransferase
MKNLNDLGILGLGSRLKRLSELLFRQLDDVYKVEKITFHARNYPLLQLLNENESMSVTQLADVLGQTHPAISQMSKKLQQKGWIYHHIDGSDERRRLLSITPAGYELLDKLTPIWQDMQVVMGRLMTTSGGNLMSNMDLLERQLSQLNLTERMVELRRERLIKSVEVVHFQPEHGDSFYKLNRHWLERYFYVEDIDHEILSDPMNKIIKPGGFVLMARIKDQIVGTAALMASKDRQLELSKMAVDEDYQGLGIGEKLLKSAIQQYQATDFKGLFLESNRQLTAALNLYDKYGFVEQESPNETSSYSRADIYMVFKEDMQQSKSA